MGRSGACKNIAAHRWRQGGGDKHCGLRISDCRKPEVAFQQPRFAAMHRVPRSGTLVQGGLNGQTANGKDQGAMPSEPRPEGRGHVPCPGTCQGEGRTATVGAKGSKGGAGLSSFRRTRRPLA